MQRSCFVYILTNKNNTVLYTGVTSSLSKRIMQHKEKFYPGSFTARYNISKLVYYEEFDYIVDAISREKFSLCSALSGGPSTEEYGFAAVSSKVKPQAMINRHRRMNVVGCKLYVVGCQLNKPTTDNRQLLTTLHLPLHLIQADPENLLGDQTQLFFIPFEMENTLPVK
jgi:predicted GIY-YIG superfamily endonuclease